MDSEINNEKGESSNQGTRDTTVETPQSKLRDLPPDKDPMGAGRKRSADNQPEE